MDIPCAIVGVGETAYSRGSGVSTLRLGAECARNAIRDAGLAPKDVDGLVLFAYFDGRDGADPLYTYDVARNLGVPEVRWQLDVNGGGHAATGIITTAMAAIQAGLCHTVVCLLALNRYSRRALRSPGSNLAAPYGLVAAPQSFALWAQRHMHEYGTTHEQLGAVAIACRRHAGLNPRAMMREPITLDDYLASRWISTPFRLLDCCLETDGGVACVVTSLERARDLRHPPVRILGGVCNTSGPATHEGRTAEEYTSMGSRYYAARLWERVGLGPRDMSFAQIYDCFTFTVISQLEDLGFCPKGAGGPWVQGGRIELGGECPINTSGGHLSEAYMRGMNLVNEGVRQLRGEYAGTPRQVKDARLGLVTSAPNPGSAIVIGRS